MAALNQAGLHDREYLEAWRCQTGESMFRGQCMNCHTVDGYRSMRRLMGGRDRKAIGNLLAMLHDPPPIAPYRNFMPPLVGTSSEVDALTDYLDALVNGKPAQVAKTRLP